MDFHTFTRRELQALCKKNKIPANLTNVAMADSLKALDIVEGIEEFLNNRSDFESEQSNMETPIAPRTARRVPIKDDAVNSQILTRTRRGAKTAVGEDHENEKLDVPETRSCRKRAPVAPVRPKMETQLDIEMKVEKLEQSNQIEEKQGVPETPIATSRMRATRSMSKVTSTRRSTRLLENKMMGLSLNGDDEIEPAKLDDDEKEDVPTKVETSVVSSEEVEELKEDTEEIKTQNLESSIQIMAVSSEEVEQLNEDSQVIKTQILESSLQSMGVVPEETEEIEDVVSEPKVDEVSGQTLNAEVEVVDEIESEISTEKLQENSEPSIQSMDVQAGEIEDDVMKTENDEAKMEEDDEIESEHLTEKLQLNKVEDEMIPNEGMDVSIDLLEDQFDKLMNLGDTKKDAVVKDYNICSLRQLKKEFKQIAANKGKKNASIEEVVNARPALQDLSENNSLEVANN